MSECIAQGLYHPNCQDSHTTYFGDFLSDDEGEEEDEFSENEVRANTDSAEYLLQQYTPEEQEQNIGLYNAEQRENYCKRQVQRFERLEEFSLDPDNQREYWARKTEWKSKLADVKKTVAKLKKDVAKTSGSGIISIEEVNPMSIRSIDMPIEQRNTGKGNPNAMLMFGIELNNRQKKLLEMLPEYDSRIVVSKNSVNMKDLAALTAYTGDEFALFTKGNERLIIRGNPVMVNIDVNKAKELAKKGYKWSGHTHPGIDFLCMQPSDGDYAIIDCFKQKSSVIYNSKGDFRTFEKRS